MAAKEPTTVVTADADMITAAVEESVGGDTTRKDEVREEEQILIPASEAVVEGSIDCLERKGRNKSIKINKLWYQIEKDNIIVFCIK